MIKIDRSNLKASCRNAECHGNLEEFLNKLSMARPLLAFKVDDECVHSYWRDKAGTEEKELYPAFNKIKVYQDGDHLGSIGVGDEYRSGRLESVYLVECFRIIKHRGRDGVKATKDITVAVREAKKVFESRSDEEVKNLMKVRVYSMLKHLHGCAENNLRWSFKDTKIIDICISAYVARKQNLAVVELGTQSSNFTTNKEDMYDNHCSCFLEIDSLCKMVDSKKGYGIIVREDSSFVVNDISKDSVKKYKSFDDLPDGIKNKVALFKVMDIHEVHQSIGVKTDEHSFYVVE